MPAHDLVIIGGGPGGYAAALYAAGAGLDVALVEKNKLGGTCLHVGCIPAKELLETASVFKTVQGASEFGVHLPEAESPKARYSGAKVDNAEAALLSVNLKVAQKRKQSIIDKLCKGVETLLSHRKVTVYSGVAELAGRDDSGKHKVSVSPSSPSDSGSSGSGSSTATKEIIADNVILASGSVPRELPLPGLEFDGEMVLSSDHVLSLEKVPSSAVIIGGGAIGCEFASMLSDLGTEVTIMEAMPNLLPGTDADISKYIERSFKKRKLKIATGVQVMGGYRHEKTIVVMSKIADPVEAEIVIVAVGRRPVTESIGAEQAGVEIDERGFVVTDELCRTNVAGIYAVGDIINTPQLAHVGFAEAIVAVSDILGKHPDPIDYERVPWGIYSHPEVAFAGLTEAAAKEEGYEVVTTTQGFRSNGRAMIIGEADGIVKVVAAKTEDGKAGQILGVHIVGPWATELIGQGYLAVNWEAQVEDLASLIQPHPTLGEIFGESLLSLDGRALHG